ncbi:unnamed protein product [Pseudo-nitzschia multistriata]|uniref:Helicase-associated domain-containing protein n=1 Tax=Pseudo-nitzschia multistriata TaxID=183589 RepID=A0A448ZGC7_9STRA|nr:unnamed protein product [Pseudo-nitzschia multistriata]
MAPTEETAPGEAVFPEENGPGIPAQESLPPQHAAPPASAESARGESPDAPDGSLSPEDPAAPAAVGESRKRTAGEAGLPSGEESSTKKAAPEDLAPPETNTERQAGPEANGPVPSSPTVCTIATASLGLPSPAIASAVTPGATTVATPGSEPRSASRIKSCLVDGCEKLRAKSGYCLRHFKDKTAPIRSGTPEYERRICVIAGCERLRSKGEHCHRHHKDPSAPIRNKADKSTDRKKKCGIEHCNRLQVKGGFCSRHFRNRSAPVLTTPAFSFDADARWDELFPQLEAFYKKHGHSRVPTSQKTDLARFVVHIRCVYRTKKQKMLREAQAVVPATPQASAANGEGHGGASDKANKAASEGEAHPDLTKSKLLTPERMEALKTVNFEFQLWTVEPSQWEQRFQELLAYRTQNGHFHVTNKQNATLSSWCKTQRQRYKNTMAIYQGLYGVELTCPQKKAKELYDKAKEKAKEAKAAAAAEEGEGAKSKAAVMSTPNLSDIGEAKNMMDPERICKLNAVGFEWELQKDTYVESWENRYNQLLKFKVLNGHCRVPKSSGDNPQLGQWVKQMRKYHGWKEDGKSYPSTFTDERISRLNELGFEWRLKDTPMKSSAAKAEAETTTPVIAARVLNNQLNNTVDVPPLQQYPPQAAAASAATISITIGNGTAGDVVNGGGTPGENGQAMNWGWGNNAYDGTSNSATV